MTEEVRLKVGELTGREDFGRGIARVDTNTMKKIGIKEGDIIEIKGKKSTAVVAIRAYPADIGLTVVRMDGLVRKNCDASIGDLVSVKKSEVKEAKKVTLAPAQKGYMLHISPNLLKQNLFMRPMIKGDILTTNPVFKSRGKNDDDIIVQMMKNFGFDIEEVSFGLGPEMRLVVVKTQPEGVTQITDMTEVELLPEAVEMEAAKIAAVTYEDVGGLGENVQKIREMIELPLKHPEVFERLGVEPPKGVLLHGAPGTGKTLLAKAVANEAGAHFISLAGAEIMSKWYGQSLPYDEEIVILENNKVKLKKIGEVVENGKKDKLKVLAFDKNGKVVFSEVVDLIKHKNKSKILKVKTRSGREIKVTDYHSLFTLKDNKIVSIKTSELIPNKSYIAVPKTMPTNGKLTKINLLEELRNNDLGLIVRDVKNYVEKSIENLGRKKVCEILGYKEKYLYDISSKNVGIRVSKFLELMEKADLKVNENEIRIGSKRKSVPAVLELTKDFCEFLGLWVAEGSYSNKGTDKEEIRISLNEGELERILELCKKIFGEVTVYSKKNSKGRDIYVCSKVSSLIIRKILGFDGDSRTKRIPEIVFNLPRDKIASFLKGYFSGDGSLYPNQHGVYTLEAGTESEKLANDILYLLLDFGIVAKRYERIEEGRHQHRICFTGVENFSKYKEIGFIQDYKNEKIKNYLSSMSWARSEQIPVFMPSLGFVDSHWANSQTIGLNKLEEFSRNAVDVPEEIKTLTDSNIYWDLVEEISETGSKEEYVYDISVEPTQNFVAGFGGIFAHNSEENLRKVFEEAEKNAPSIIFIDEVDAIAPKREEVTGEVERRVVSTLLTQMDGLKSRGKVIVIAATNRVNSLDPALRRGGRFDREIEIGVPDKKGRKEIFQIHTRNMPTDKDVSLDDLSDITYGFVGADIQAVTKEAAMHALRRVLPDVAGLEEDKPFPKDVLEKLRVNKDDFDYALRMVQPSAMREVLIEVPKVKWNDIGGLEEVKSALKESVEWPLQNPESFKRMGISPPRGILLYGPPGCGKTLIAKAVASESGANFIAIKGPEVFSKWVGESEKMIRDIFRRAKQVAPSIIFFDEIDALAPKRGTEIGTHVTEQVVSQLLTEMSGIQDMEGVVVLAATNRPDILDSALLRPGRFDRLIYVPAPDADARLSILKIHTKHMPLKGVDVEKLVKDTERYSGADIEALVREAALFALREDIDSKLVTIKHFEKALKKIKPSITEDIFKKYQQAVEDLKKVSMEEKTRYIG